MQPPRRRRPKVARSLARLTRLGTIELGSILLALLLVRAIMAAVVGGERPGFATAIARLTEPLVWPLAQLPGGSVQLIRQLTLADLATMAVIATLGALVVGVAAGWEAEGRR